MEAPPRPLNRREFLARIGVLGGATALYGAMDSLGLMASPANAQTVDFIPPSRDEVRGRRPEVLVLGAGIAGLTTAYELQKAGYRCTVLEARDRPGGRNWTARNGTTLEETDGTTDVCRFSPGQYMNMGPARIPQHHVTLDYCRELGVPVEVFTNANADAYYYQEGPEFGPLSGQPIRHREAKANYYGYVSELLAKAIDQDALNGSLTGDDTERMLEFLRSFGDLDAAYNYTGSSRAGYVPGEEPGAWFAEGTPKDPIERSQLLQSRIGGYFSFELSWNQAMLMYQPVGGMDRIADALADAVGRGRIRYDAQVFELNNTSDGVEVVYGRRGGQSRRMTADYCVATIPPQILKDIPSNLSPAVKDALGVPVPFSTGKVGLEYDRRFWEIDEHILGGITGTTLDVNTIWYPSYGYLSNGPGVVVGAYNFGGTADEYAALSPAQRTARAVDAGAKIHGDAYRDTTSAFTVAWIKQPFSNGGWVFWPGGRGDAYRLLTEPDGNVYFAGDHLSYYIAWQAGAFLAARNTVMALHDRVTAA